MSLVQYDCLQLKMDVKHVLWIIVLVVVLSWKDASRCNIVTHLAQILQIPNNIHCASHKRLCCSVNHKSFEYSRDDRGTGWHNEEHCMPWCRHISDSWIRWQKKHCFDDQGRRLDYRRDQCTYDVLKLLYGHSIPRWTTATFVDRCHYLIIPKDGDWK